MSDQLLYYAYGSNLHPARLGARIPTSVLLGVAELSGYQLQFHKRGGDLSAKCNAVFTGQSHHLLLGALYQMSAREKPLLDEIEGEGYAVESVEIRMAGRLHRAFAYIAEEHFIDNQLKPFHWYKEFVRLGAEYHDFPHHYIDLIRTIDSMDDHNLERHQRNEQVLALMR